MKKGICSCEREGRIVCFEFRGVRVKSNGAGQSSEKFKEIWIKDFEEWEEKCLGMAGRGLVSLEARKPKVDWTVYEYLRKEGSDIFHLQTLRILMDLGIFSHNPSGGWEITVGKFFQNPYLEGILYFRDEWDAREYAEKMQLSKARIQPAS